MFNSRGIIFKLINQYFGETVGFAKCHLFETYTFQKGTKVWQMFTQIGFRKLEIPVNEY